MLHSVFFENLKIFAQNNLKTKRVVLVGGCFDILHYGHLQFLKAAKQQGDFLIVALESDDFIKKYKNRTPTHTIQERKELLEALHLVDYVIDLPLLQGYDDYLLVTQTISPTVIAITENDPQMPNKIKQAHSVGASVVTVTPQIGTLSSSTLAKTWDQTKNL